jgi:hypothetical protein
MKMNWLNIQITLWKKISKIKIDIKYSKKMHSVGEGIGVAGTIFSKI